MNIFSSHGLTAGGNEIFIILNMKAHRQVAQQCEGCLMIFPMIIL